MAQARRIPADSPDALALVRAMVAEISAQYGPQVEQQTPSATPDDLSPPGGCFVVLYEDGRAVAGGGVKRLHGAMGEIKRMYVVPDRRGHGLGRQLLAALEREARTLGYSAVRLDTGVHQQEALALYESAGYRPITDYNGNVHASFWGEKALEG